MTGPALIPVTHTLAMTPFATAVTLAVSLAVYLGMALGRVPGLGLDRTGCAVLGAIVLLAAGVLSPAEAWAGVDAGTLELLFGLMVVSAQLRLGGFYTAVTRRMARARCGPGALLALVVLAAGGLSAVLANDIVCLAMTPVLLAGCRGRGLDPAPFLLALACAANVGSAATCIGNPQNMLIGQVLSLSFSGYLADALPPSLAGLGAVWALTWLLYRRTWRRPAPPSAPEPEPVPFSLARTAKGLVVLAILVVVFQVGGCPRELAALAAAGLLLVSRRTASARLLGLVDWSLLLLFMGLFMVNRALADSGLMARLVALLAAWGADPTHPAWLFALGVPLSNLVSNVPATMLLLPGVQAAPAALAPGLGLVLALATTLAGNLLLVGSIANLIVAEQAAPLGVTIGWRTHLRLGLPVTLATLAIAALWLWWRWGGLAVAG